MKRYRKTKIFPALFILLFAIVNFSFAQETPKSTVTDTDVVYLSGSRQRILPGYDDGSGMFSENWIIRLKAPVDFHPEISLEYMGFVIPVQKQISYISESESVLMFTVVYPLEDHYDGPDENASAIPVLHLKTGEKEINLELRNLQILKPRAYPVR